MNRKSFDLGLICLLALLTMTVTLLEVDIIVLRLLLGLPLVLILPGYALTAALFPSRQLAWADVVLFTLGLSMGSTILSGFVLNWLPWGVRPDTRVVMLTFITLGGSIIAFGGRYLAALALPSAVPELVMEQPGSQTSEVRGWPTFGLNPVQIILFGLALVIVVGAIILARSEAQRHPPADVIQLWMMPMEPRAADSFRLGINSLGAASGTFRLQLQQDGYILREWSPLVITPGEEWAETVTLREQQPGDGPIEARLYRQEEPRVVYRKVIIWTDVPQ